MGGGRGKGSSGEREGEGGCWGADMLLRLSLSPACAVTHRLVILIASSRVKNEVCSEPSLTSPSSS